MPASHQECRECGTPVSSSDKEFCCKEHKQAFHNRRSRRGAELYDLFRAMRRERDAAKALGLWAEMCRLEKKYNDEDQRERPGRRSYIEPKRALANLADKGSLPRGTVYHTAI